VAARKATAQRKSSLLIDVARALSVGRDRAAGAADVVINNGLDCSNPGNVINDYTYEDDDVYVRSAGCPPFGAINPDDPRPSPGARQERQCIKQPHISCLRASHSRENAGLGKLLATAFDVG
jgi:hypothetical protein